MPARGKTHFVFATNESVACAHIIGTDHCLPNGRVYWIIWRCITQQHNCSTARETYKQAMPQDPDRRVSVGSGAAAGAGLLRAADEVRRHVGRAAADSAQGGRARPIQGKGPAPAVCSVVATTHPKHACSARRLHAQDSLQRSEGAAASFCSGLMCVWVLHAGHPAQPGKGGARGGHQLVRVRGDQAVHGHGPALVGSVSQQFQRMLVWSGGVMHCGRQRQGKADWMLATSCWAEVSACKLILQHWPGVAIGR